MKATQRHDVLLNEFKAGHIAKTADELMDVKTTIKLLQKNLEDIDTHLNEGAYIRCGTAWNWICESEAPTKIFFLNKKNGAANKGLLVY